MKGNTYTPALHRKTPSLFLLILFVVTALALLAVGRSSWHMPRGSDVYPHQDCGSNWALRLELPGTACTVGIVSSKTVKDLAAAEDAAARARMGTAPDTQTAGALDEVLARLVQLWSK